MDTDEQINSLFNLGLFKSVTILSSLNKSGTVNSLMAKAKAHIQLKNYHLALETLEILFQNTLTEDEFIEYLELKFTCFLNSHNGAEKCSALFKYIENRKLSLKLHILVANAYILVDSTHSPNHPAIPHLLEVLKVYPFAIELVEKLISIGGSIDSIIEELPPGNEKEYLQSLDLFLKNECVQSNQIILSSTNVSAENKSIPFLITVCKNAVYLNDFDLFDRIAAMIPLNELEIIDLRAARLFDLKKIDELRELVLYGLNINENNANSWIAFSYYLELNHEDQRALHAMRKALLIEPNSRKANMRQGEMRFQRNDYKKALNSFKKAHAVREDIDSYRAIIKCYGLLDDWKTAELYAAHSLLIFPEGSKNETYSLEFMGYAIKEKDKSKAIDFLSLSLEKSPDNLNALSTLLDIFTESNDFESAEKYLTKYKGEQKDFYFWIKSAEIAGMKNNIKRAIECVSEALILKPDDSRALDILYHLQRVQDGRVSSEYDSENDITL